VSPEPKALHFDVAENVFELLKSACDKKLHKVAQRMNLRFPDADSMPSPDVFVVDRAEWQLARKEEVYTDGSKVLLAVEVISPSNRPTPLAEKVTIYVEHGIETWVVEPKKQEVKVHRRGEPIISASFRLQSVLRWNDKAVPLSAVFQHVSTFLQPFSRNRTPTVREGRANPVHRSSQNFLQPITHFPSTVYRPSPPANPTRPEPPRCYFLLRRAMRPISKNPRRISSNVNRSSNRR
jgi:Uma2 family endonuclease